MDDKHHIKTRRVRAGQPVTDDKWVEDEERQRLEDEAVRSDLIALVLVIVVAVSFAVFLLWRIEGAF